MTLGQLVAERLRIAHVVHTFPPYRGGTGAVAWHLSRELAALGHEVHVITAALGGEQISPPGVEVHRLRALVRVGNAPALPGLFRQLAGYDLIHLHYPFFFGAESVWMLARLRKIPYVVTYHQDVRLTGILRPVPGVYKTLIGNRVLADAERVTFSSLAYGRGSDAAWLLSSGRAVELPFGVDAQRFSPLHFDEALRAKFDPGGDRVLILFVASLDRAHYFKGLPVLLGAMKLLGQSNAHLLVVGDGDLRPMYETMGANLGLNSRVHFQGAVEDDVLARLYATADVLVLPSVTRGEAFGLVLLESMASGTPVIATDLPGVRTLVNNTGGGLVVQPDDPKALADALRTLIERPPLRAELGERGRDAARGEYSWPSIAERLSTVYAACVQRTPISSSSRLHE